MHATLFAVGGIIAALAAPQLVARFGRSRVLTIALVTFCLGIAGYLIPAGPAVTLPSIGLISLAAATLIISLSAFLLDHQGRAGPASLTQANAFTALAGVIAPIVIGFGAAIVLGWRFGIAVMVVGILLLELFFRRPIQHTFNAKATDQQKALPWRQLPRRMWWSILVVALITGVELTTFLWAADLLRDRAGASPALAAGLVSALAIGMVVGRLAGARLTQSWAIDSLLLIGGCVALGGFAIAWLSNQALPITVGLFIIGLGIALNWPLGIARSVQASGGWATQATSLVSLASGIMLAIIPITLGAIAERIGIHRAFFLLPVLLVIALIILRLKPEPPANVPSSSPHA